MFINIYIYVYVYVYKYKYKYIYIYIHDDICVFIYTRTYMTRYTSKSNRHQIRVCGDR